MALSPINYAAGQDTVQQTYDKINLGFVATNTINDTLTNRSKNNTSWTGAQALTASYVNVGTLTFTTPNDAITRTYLILAEMVIAVSSGVGDNQADFRIENTSDATQLKVNSIAFPDVGSGSTAKIQTSLFYIGTIAPNKTIVLQAKKPTSNGVSAISASLTLLEVIR